MTPAHLEDEQLSRQLDGDLGRDAGAEVEQHLACCEQCRNRWGRLQLCITEVGQPVPLDNPAAERLIDAALGRVPVHGPPRHRWPRLLPAAAAVALAVACAALFAYGFPSGSTSRAASSAYAPRSAPPTGSHGPVSAGQASGAPAGPASSRPRMLGVATSGSALRALARRGLTGSGGTGPAPSPDCVSSARVALGERSARLRAQATATYLGRPVELFAFTNGASSAVDVLVTSSRGCGLVTRFLLPGP